jgi:hypothetical protein
MSVLLRKIRDTLSSTGISLSSNPMVYVMLIIAVVLTIASMLVPYYTDSTGASSGVYGSGKDCLGYSGQDCMTMHALPIVTILFGVLTILFMANIPILTSTSGVKKLGEKIPVIGITIIPVLFLAMIFSVITLGTQLGMPLSGVSLADQAKNSSNTTTFKDGMALSAASTALFVFVFIIKTGIISSIASIM